MNTFKVTVVLGLLTGYSITIGVRTPANPWTDSLLANVRAAAASLPGPRPLEVRHLTFASLVGRLGQYVATADTTPVDVSYGVFQIVFLGRWIMVDAGFDRATADRFLRPEAALRYWPERYEQVRDALIGADQVVLTHEQRDHAAGVVGGPRSAEIAARTLISDRQARYLIESGPGRNPLLPVDANLRFRVVSFEKLLTIAPGVVLVSAPGHSPGSQLVYVQTSDGREILLVGDLVKMSAGLAHDLQKPATAMPENRRLVSRTMDWVRRAIERDRVVAVPSHDMEWLRSLDATGVLREGLQVAGAPGDGEHPAKAGHR